MSTGAEETAPVVGAAALPVATLLPSGFRTLGTLQEFNPESEDIFTYLERVEIYFAANDVSDEKRYLFS